MSNFSPWHLKLAPSYQAVSVKQIGPFLFFFSPLTQYLGGLWHLLSVLVKEAIYVYSYQMCRHNF